MSVKRYEGKLLAPPEATFAVVVSRFNEFVTSKLLGGALDAFARHGVAEGNVEVVWAPGSFEVPLLAQRLAGSGKYAAVVCLGAVIRGGPTTTSTSPRRWPRAWRRPRSTRACRASSAC